MTSCPCCGAALATATSGEPTPPAAPRPGAVDAASLLRRLADSLIGELVQIAQDGFEPTQEERRLLKRLVDGGWVEESELALLDWKPRGVLAAGEAQTQEAEKMYDRV